jgi:hypothetical protein
METPFAKTLGVCELKLKGIAGPELDHQPAGLPNAASEWAQVVGRSTGSSARTAPHLTPCC